jgi:hypothetical protein
VAGFGLAMWEVVCALKPQAKAVTAKNTEKDQEAEKYLRVLVLRS